jgi:uncharacterized protein YbjQ (UPF0145 family)
MRKSGSGKRIICGIGTLLGLLIPLVVIGCASTKGEFVKLGTEIYPPKSGAQEILLTQGDINKPYKEMGLVKAKGDEDSTEKECLDKIRQIAKEAGADAVIKAHAEETESLVSKKIQVGKFPRTVTFKIKEPVCEGTAVVFTKNG